MALCKNESKVVYENKICPQCGKEFVCQTSNKKTNKTFCSRSCASAGSVTEARILAGKTTGALNLQHSADSAAASLRLRENWKYNEIQKFLRHNKINHQFEYVIEKFIYDLAIIDLKILIEFDGPDHQWSNDEPKNNLSKSYGWTLIRITTDPNKEIKVHDLIYAIPILQTQEPSSADSLHSATNESL